MRLAMLFSALLIGLFSSQSFAQIRVEPPPPLPPPPAVVLPPPTTITLAPPVTVHLPPPPSPPVAEAPGLNCHQEETDDAPRMQNGVLTPAKRKILVCDPK
jgi:hypothetical protein